MHRKVNLTSKKIPNKYERLLRILYLIIGIGIVIYWVSSFFIYKNSEEILLKGKIRGYSKEPFGVNIEYNIQKIKKENLPDYSIGDKISLTIDGNLCKKGNCFSLIINDIDENFVYLDFEENFVPTFFTMKEFQEKIIYNKTNKQLQYVLVYGKFINNRFIITKIEFK